MPYCERLSEQLGVVATIDPIALLGTVAVSDIFSMAMHRRALFILQTEAAFAAATVMIQENVAQAFTAGTATLLTGAAATVIGNSSQYLYEISAASLTTGFTWVRASIAGMTIGDIISMVVLADVERYHPATDYDLGTVTIQATA